MATHITSTSNDTIVSSPATDSPDSSSPNGSSPSKSRWHAAATILHDGIQVDRRLPYFVFDPDSSVVCYWMAAVAMATLYNAWMIALRLAFPEIRQQPTPSYLGYLDIFSDVIYLVDIAVQFRTAHLQDGIPVFDPAKIRQHYSGQQCFVRDLISAVPTESILSLLPDSLGIPKYWCTTGAARLTKLLKFHVLYRFYDLAESRTSNPHFIRVFRMSLSLAIIIHWIACLYYWVSEYEGLGFNNWVYTNAPDQQRFCRKYILCMYWSAMTLTTIGNCNPPETDLEYIFTGIIFLTGVFVFATVLGNVGDVISSMNANRQEFQARMDHIKMYLTHKKVPASLQLKIKKWAEYSWSRTKATDESRLLNMLPERLRAEVAVHVHLDSLKKVKIFEQCETGFLCELVLKLRSQVFSPGDFICKAGETGREMFIINHGKVEVLVPNPATNKEMVVAMLCEGNYFGEISLLRLDGVQNRRTADVRSIGYSELLCLSRRDLMAALVEYPEAKSILESQAKKRMKTSLQAQRAFSVDCFLRSSQEYSSTDSGTPFREDGRGRDVSEIKAMIEELKNANKVPGRTIWQLIARCELLQAKVKEKEKEVEDSKMRIVELEAMLGTHRHKRLHRLQGFDQHLRPYLKVQKQFSQEEGRYATLDSNDEERRTKLEYALNDSYFHDAKTNEFSEVKHFSSLKQCRGGVQRMFNSHAGNGVNKDGENVTGSFPTDGAFHGAVFLKTSKINYVRGLEDDDDDEIVQSNLNSVKATEENITLVDSSRSSKLLQNGDNNLPLQKEHSAFKDFTPKKEINCEEYQFSRKFCELKPNEDEVFDRSKFRTSFSQKLLDMDLKNYDDSKKYIQGSCISTGNHNLGDKNAKFPESCMMTLEDSSEQDIETYKQISHSSSFSNFSSSTHSIQPIPEEDEDLMDSGQTTAENISDYLRRNASALSDSPSQITEAFYSSIDKMEAEDIDTQWPLTSDIPIVMHLCDSLDNLDEPFVVPDGDRHLLRLSSLSSNVSDESNSRRSSCCWDSEKDSDDDNLSND